MPSTHDSCSKLHEPDVARFLSTLLLVLLVMLMPLVLCSSGIRGQGQSLHFDHADAESTAAVHSQVSGSSTSEEFSALLV